MTASDARAGLVRRTDALELLRLAEPSLVSRLKDSVRSRSLRNEKTRRSSSSAASA